MLLVNLMVNSSLLVVGLLGSQKLYTIFNYAWGQWVSSPNPHVTQGSTAVCVCVLPLSIGAHMLMVISWRKF